MSAAEDAAIIAGGIDLVRRLRSGDTADTLIDLSGLKDLRAIEDRGDFVRIGALATHWDIETSPLLSECLTAFQAAWTTIGNVRIRMTGTLGGNLMAAEPTYDGPVLLGVLGAKLVFLSSAGETSVAASIDPRDYPSGALLISIDVPVSPTANLAFDRSLKPVVSVAAGLDGSTVSIAVGCAYPSPMFWTGHLSELPDGLAAALPDPIDNPMGSGAYRRRMISLLSRRLLEQMQVGFEL